MAPPACPRCSLHGAALGRSGLEWAALGVLGGSPSFPLAQVGGWGGTGEVGTRGVSSSDRSPLTWGRESRQQGTEHLARVPGATSGPAATSQVSSLLSHWVSTPIKCGCWIGPRANEAPC